MKDPAPAKNRGGFSPGTFFQRRNFYVSIGIAVVLLIIIPRFFGRKVKTDKPQSALSSEQRRVYKESDLAQAIEKAQVSAGSTKKRLPERPSRRRNYATDIAVFLQEDTNRESVPASLHVKTKDELGLPAGTKIPAYLSGTLFSFNVAAPVTVVVSKDFERGGNIVIPAKSQFLGRAGVLKSLDRINVDFHLLVLPDGRQIRIRAMALSEDGSAGIKGRVSKHRDMRIFRAIGEAALAGASLFVGGLSSQPYTLEDQLRMNLAQNLTQEARQDLRGVKVESSITVDSFTPVQVILLEAI